MRAAVLIAFGLTAVLAELSDASDVRVSIQSYPSNLPVLFDDVAGITSFNVMVPDSSAHRLSAVTPQEFAPGSRYVFDHWRLWDLSVIPTPSFEFTVIGDPTISHIYTAIYQRQYAVTLSQVPGGRIEPGPGTTWLDADSSLTIRALPSPGYSFREWVGNGYGSYSGTNPSVTLVAHGPMSEHASFEVNTITTTIETIPHRLTVTVDGVPRVTPFTLTQEANQAILLDAPASQATPEGEVRFVDWNDGGARTHVIGPSVSATWVVTYAPLPGRSWMTAAWPNPSSGSSRLELALASSGPASLVIRDLRGRIIRRLVEATLPAGIHPVAWDGRDDRGQPVPSGIYFAVGRWAGFEGEQRIVQLR